MSYKARYPCDLHTHTIASDGNDTYAQLIAAAAQAGVEILAITDHDVVAADMVPAEDGSNLPLDVFAAQMGVRVLRGIEFSCDTLVDDVHIVALGCDFDDPRFEQERLAAIQSKIDGYRQLCDILTRDGMPILWQEDILANQGRPIPETMVQRKLIFEAMARKGYAPDWSAAKLLVKNTPRYNIPRKKPDPLYIVWLITETGGLAVLAHPYLIADEVSLQGKPMTRKEYIGRLLDAGLTGIEASYPYDKTSYAGSLSPEEIEIQVREEYGDKLKILSGGSDYHNEGKKGSKNPRLPGERGVTMEYFRSSPLLAALL